MNGLNDLERDLNSFDPETRRQALRSLARSGCGRFGPESDNHNMHVHSFFSYNAEGWSPSHIAWCARTGGWYSAGLCDFDVLDGLEEFLDAGLLLGLRTAVSLETRVYVGEYADRDISSPGEAGVAYIMGAGFTSVPKADSAAGAILAGYREAARRRNEALVERVNRNLGDIRLDYAGDVQPLTPSGNATERHIVSAYVSRAIDRFEHPAAVAAFWAKVLGREVEDVVERLADRPRLEEAVRARLVKRGGIGYEAPSPRTFPPVEDFIDWVLSCEAIPMATWLDGTSGGERDARALLEFMTAKGAAALNIIPDRNWNVADPAERAVKVANLQAIIAAAEELGLPVNIGTEMNKLGLPVVDDLAADALRPHREVFLRGARILVGHSILQRYAGLSYAGEQTRERFGDIRSRNAFFERAGALPPLTTDIARRLEDRGPERAFEWFRDAIGWT